ncbi:hypothetical protein [Dyadobacter sandarakinus]|uniref:SPW repeat-containing protein n=1 Tax=Dyadobacter sandarakinus TaxID=2747268 RepID=A0ABX7I222_9BACT|nr:hypothetical protein [Dyadobacter sandarakinus]QRQ99829.1 hypothetical protein HWI92_02300 [Dyadobacter sandarakinus]
MKTKVHPDFIKASNLIFVSAALGIISVLIAGKDLSDARVASALIMVTGITCATAHLIRRGVEWVRYFFMASVVIGTLLAPFIWGINIKTASEIIIYIIQGILQIWAFILLFKARSTGYIPDSNLPESQQ